MEAVSVQAEATEIAAIGDVCRPIIGGMGQKRQRRAARRVYSHSTREMWRGLSRMYLRAKRILMCIPRAGMACCFLHCCRRFQRER